MSGEVKLAAEAELVERVARAIREAHLEHKFNPLPGQYVTIGLEPGLSDKLARAAIAATRPPVVTGQDGER